MNQEIREQLSALIDNELDRDRTRFLLKRAEHDADLTAVWQRWHFVGEAMRGSALPLRKDFARSIAARLDEEAGVVTLPAPRHSGALRWGGGFAVAASVALAALLFARPDAGIAPVVPDSDLASLPAPVLDAAIAPAVVAPSPYREQDLRPPYRLDAQTVSSYEARRAGNSLRFDPNYEATWLRHQQAVNGRAEQAAWMVPLRPDAAESANRR